MTQLERIAQQEARALDAVAKKKADLANVQTVKRALVSRARQKRRAEVGALAELAGLFVYDNAMLSRAFVALARMSQTDPQAVRDLLGLDAILHGEVDVIVVTDEGGVPLGAPGENGMADAAASCGTPSAIE